MQEHGRTENPPAAPPPGDDATSSRNDDQWSATSTMSSHSSMDVDADADDDAAPKNHSKNYTIPENKFDIVETHRMHDEANCGISDNALHTLKRLLFKATIDPEGLLGRHHRRCDHVTVHGLTVTTESARTPFSNSHIRLTQNITEADGPHRAERAFQQLFHAITGRTMFRDDADQETNVDEAMQLFSYVALPYCGAKLVDDDDDDYDASEQDARLPSAPLAVRWRTFEILEELLLTTILRPVRWGECNQVTRRTYDDFTDHNDFRNSFIITTENENNENLN